MFTGIIECTAKVLEHQEGVLKLKTPHWDGLELGQSIAINGCCLTICAIDQETLSFQISPETFEKTSMSNLNSGDWVNVERAMQLGDRLDGHLVSGHVDGIGTIKEIKAQEQAETKYHKVDIFFPQAQQHWMIPKGSITVDGVSLTINEIHRDFFSVMIIPHTWIHTRFSLYQIGAAVNLEFDMIAKYIHRMQPNQGVSHGS
ncbi:MAG: riboflavin synthase [Bdellovibrionales bacterium]|nr:riboflavin synthase [Bdellovibrionales bacterium]